VDSLYSAARKCVVEVVLQSGAAKYEVGWGWEALVKAGLEKKVEEVYHGEFLEKYATGRNMPPLTPQDGVQRCRGAVDTLQWGGSALFDALRGLATVAAGNQLNAADSEYAKAVATFDEEVLASRSRWSRPSARAVQVDPGSTALSAIEITKHDYSSLTAFNLCF
jgi:hypothetical protein